MTPPVFLSSRLLLARHTIRRRASEDIAVVAEPFTVEWNGTRITVPEDFGTDLSSVPKAVPKWIASRVDGIEASVVHDYLYVSGEQTRAFADSLFREMLRLDRGVPAWRREVMYRGVRLFGGALYEKRHGTQGVTA